MNHVRCILDLLGFLVAVMTLMDMVDCKHSSLCRSFSQENLISSLDFYQIINPKLSLSPNVTESPVSWEAVKNILPNKLNVQIELENGHKVVLQLHQKNDLVSNKFKFEDVLDLDNGNTVSRSNQYPHPELCFYSGYIIGIPISKVTMSICDGLHGYINNEDTSYLIEPMKRTNQTFFHLLYKSGLNNKTGDHQKPKESMSCQTKMHLDKNDYDDEDERRRQILSYHTPPNSRRENRLHRKSSTDRFPIASVEVLVVADKSMIEFHGNDSIEDYVLTMMNMVSDMYRDPSLGVIVNIVVSKLLILSTDPEKMSSKKNTLSAFCEWQFVQSLREKSSMGNFDTALLLTRKGICLQSGTPCSTIGLAYIGGMCSSNRRCAVVEDFGLTTAYTIAHELGHLLSMTHDSVDNTCGKDSSGSPHMMAPGWPTSNHLPLVWSTCSARKLQKFLSSFKSECIQRKPTAFNVHYQHRKKFPGELYDADTQCKQQYGNFAKHCQLFKRTGFPSDLCKQLWCEVEEEKYCVSKLDPAAKGTECAPGKWCMYGQCMNNTNIPHPIHGGWSDWSEWTQCTRSCHVGVTFRERFCDSPEPRNGGRQCPGKEREYETCNTQDCPEPFIDFRLFQCAKRNNDSIKYIPAHSIAEPCALHCRREGFRSRSVRFEPLAIDGTPCYDGSPDICVNGQCRKLGCDLKLDSKLSTDMCGVCGGKDDTCKKVEGKFTQPLGEGYVNAVDIPKGARNIYVEEVKPCPSFLALVNGPGTYHINGNFTIKLPGRYNVNGTSVLYERKGTQELFYLKGPITSTMHFKVLFQGFNLGVKYQYVLPIDNSTRPQMDRADNGSDHYGWMQGSWETCSVHCGGGIMRREKPICLSLKKKVAVVGDDKCKYAKIPPIEERACNENRCEKVWFATAWSSCSQTCGEGRKKRIVTCQEMQPNGTYILRSGNVCPLATKPTSIATCIDRSCYLSWRISPWSQCHAKCGHTGFKYRSVQCPMKNACLLSRKPDASKLCRAPSCSHQWTVQPWNKCSKRCGTGTQTRIVSCRKKGTLKLDPGKCDHMRKPQTIQNCNIEKCQSVLTKRYKVLSGKRIPKFRNVSYNSPRNQGSGTKRVRSFKKGKKFLNISAPLSNRSNCQRNRLLTFYCRMKVTIYRVAGGGEYCETKQAQEECCKYCRDLKMKKRKR